MTTLKPSNLSTALIRSLDQLADPDGSTYDDIIACLERNKWHDFSNCQTPHASLRGRAYVFIGKAKQILKSECSPLTAYRKAEESTNRLKLGSLTKEQWTAIGIDPPPVHGTSTHPLPPQPYIPTPKATPVARTKRNRDEEKGKEDKFDNNNKNGHVNPPKDGSKADPPSNEVNDHRRRSTRIRFVRDHREQSAEGDGVDNEFREENGTFTSNSSSFPSTTTSNSRPDKSFVNLVTRMKSGESIPVTKESLAAEIAEDDEWGFDAEWSDAEEDETETGGEPLKKRRKTDRYNGMLRMAEYTLRSAQNDLKLSNGIEKQMEIYLAARAMEAYARKLDSRAKLVEAETRLVEARIALAKLCHPGNEE